MASVVLTGGGIGTKVLAELAAAPARDAVDWRRVEVWWGDERFLPTGDPERNETGARTALLDHVEVLPGHVHPMPGPDGPDGPNPEAAADRYASELRAAAQPQDRGGVPRFDVLMLGIGPDGHVASLFPGAPALYEEDRTVVAVRGAPKPPPVGCRSRCPRSGPPPRYGSSPPEPRRRERCGWPCPARARCRCRPPERAARSRRCSCLIAPRRRKYPCSSAGSPRPESAGFRYRHQGPFWTLEPPPFA